MLDDDKWTYIAIGYILLMLVLGLLYVIKEYL